MSAEKMGIQLVFRQKALLFISFDHYDRLKRIDKKIFLKGSEV